jgi:hypothetical protein
MPYIHYIIRYPWTVVRGNGAEINIIHDLDRDLCIVVSGSG